MIIITIRKNFLSTIFRRKEKKKIIFHFSNILPNPSKRIPPPSSNIRNSTPGKLAGPCIPLHPLLCFHKSQRGRALQEWAGAGAPTVTLGAPVAATLASFLLLLFVIPSFLRLFPSPFLRCLAHFFVLRNFLNAFLRSFVTASLFFFL